MSASASASAYDEHFAHVTRFTRLPLHAVGLPFVLKDNSGSIFERGKWGYIHSHTAAI